MKEIKRELNKTKDYICAGTKQKGTKAEILKWNGQESGKAGCPVKISPSGGKRILNVAIGK